MKKRKLLTLAFLLYLAISAVGQETPDGYNPFVPANLDDPLKLTVAPVVESSYHRYSVIGDQKYTDPSTFVWYVENGTLGTYDPDNDVWTPIRTLALGAGEYLEKPGTTVGTNRNSSEIWVRWNDNSGGRTGYIAVYERSADNCIISDMITGYKHNILLPPEIWFAEGTREECSDQTYAVTVQFNQLHTDSYPYTFTFSYPGNDGIYIQDEYTLLATDLTSSLQYTFDLQAVQDLTYGTDETYQITLLELRDKYGSDGKIAPLGATAGQYDRVNITILHLPRTEGMSMD